MMFKKNLIDLYVVIVRGGGVLTQELMITYVK